MKELSIADLIALMEYCQEQYCQNTSRTYYSRIRYEAKQELESRINQLYEKI